MSDSHASAEDRQAPSRDHPDPESEGLNPGPKEPSSPGFERITVGGAQILARTRAVSWSRQAVLAHGSLYRAARASAFRTLHGRGPLPVLTNPAGVGPPWVVRRYYRGGLMRAFGDRFLRTGRPRSFVELENNLRIEEMGFATPRIVAAAVYPKGVFYRADLVTEFVPNAPTLADVLFGTNDPSDHGSGSDARREALACTAKLITRLARAGVHHRDLHVENVLIARRGQHVHAVLLDLDRCKVAGPGGPVDAGRLRRRLARSIRKLERTRSWSQVDGEGQLTDDEMNCLLSEGTAS